jgi:hypothetical protein
MAESKIAQLIRKEVRNAILEGVFDVTLGAGRWSTGDTIRCREGFHPGD